MQCRFGFDSRCKLWILWLVVGKTTRNKKQETTTTTANDIIVGWRTTVVSKVVNGRAKRRFPKKIILVTLGSKCNDCVSSK